MIGKKYVKKVCSHPHSAPPPPHPVEKNKCFYLTYFRFAIDDCLFLLKTQPVKKETEESEDSLQSGQDKNIDSDNHDNRDCLETQDKKTL